MARQFPEPTLIDHARALRLNSTEAEKYMWNALRNRQIDGHKFRRQYPFGNYILDFACEAERIAIELDGGQHNDPEHQIRDSQRTAFLALTGWRVLRFWNHDVLENLEGVSEVIRHALTLNHEG